MGYYCSNLLATCLSPRVNHMDGVYQGRNFRLPGGGQAVCAESLQIYLSESPYCRQFRGAVHSSLKSLRPAPINYPAKEPTLTSASPDFVSQKFQSVHGTGMRGAAATLAPAWN